MKLIQEPMFCAMTVNISLMSWAQSSPAESGDPARLSGYTAQSSKLERNWERKLQDGIARDNLREKAQNPGRGTST